MSHFLKVKQTEEKLCHKKITFYVLTQYVPNDHFIFLGKKMFEKIEYFSVYNETNQLNILQDNLLHLYSVWDLRISTTCEIHVLQQRRNIHIQ